MRMGLAPAALAAVLLLAGCERGGQGSASGNDTAFALNVQDDDGKMSIKGDASGVSIDSPVVSGKLRIPGLQLGGDHMDIDGMKPFPGTKFGAINVDARDKGGSEDRSRVEMRFTAPATPDKVLAYYADAAKGAGYETAGVSGGSLAASKADGSQFTVIAAPSAGGSEGTLIVNDKG